MSGKHNNGLAWPTNGKSNVRYAKYLITVITLIFPTEGVGLALAIGIASGSASGLSQWWSTPSFIVSAFSLRGGDRHPHGARPRHPHWARPRLPPPGSTSATTPRHGARLRPLARAPATPPPRPRPRHAHGARPRPPSRPKGLGLSDPPPPSTGLGHGHPQGALPPHGARSPHLTGLGRPTPPHAMGLGLGHPTATPTGHPHASRGSVSATPTGLGLGTLLMGSALALGLGLALGAQPDMYKYFNHVHTFYDLYAITILA